MLAGVLVDDDVRVRQGRLGQLRVRRVGLARVQTAASFSFGRMAPHIMSGRLDGWHLMVVSMTCMFWLRKSIECFSFQMVISLLLRLSFQSLKTIMVCIKNMLSLILFIVLKIVKSSNQMEHDQERVASKSYLNFDDIFLPICACSQWT